MLVCDEMTADFGAQLMILPKAKTKVKTQIILQCGICADGIILVYLPKILHMLSFLLIGENQRTSPKCPQALPEPTHFSLPTQSPSHSLN